MSDILDDPVARYVYDNHVKIGLEDFPFYIDYDDVVVFEKDEPSDNFIDLFIHDITSLTRCVCYVFDNGFEEIRDSLINQIYEICEFRLLSILFDIAHREGEFPIDDTYELIEQLERSGRKFSSALTMVCKLDGMPELE